MTYADYKTGDHVEVTYTRLKGKTGTIVGEPSGWGRVFPVELDGSLERHEIHMTNMKPAPKIKITVRLEGEKISPVDVKVGDTIRAVRKPSPYGQTDFSEGVVTTAKLNGSGSASLFTTGMYDGCLYSPAWQNVDHLILVKAAKDKHPLEGAKIGTKFQTDKSSGYYVSTKIQEDWWTVEEYSFSGTLVNVMIARENDVRKAYTNNNGKMVK